MLERNFGAIFRGHWAIFFTEPFGHTGPHWHWHLGRCEVYITSLSLDYVDWHMPAQQIINCISQSPGWPYWANYRPTGICFFFEPFLYNPIQMFGLLNYVLILINKWSKNGLDGFFYTLIWPPCLSLVMSRGGSGLIRGSGSGLSPTFSLM
jgi:hypothetical protein